MKSSQQKQTHALPHLYSPVVPTQVSSSTQQKYHAHHDSMSHSLRENLFLFFSFFSLPIPPISISFIHPKVPYLTTGMPQVSHRLRAELTQYYYFV